MSAVPNVVAPENESGQWKATEGRPQLDIKGKVVTGPKSYGMGDSRRRIVESYEIKWRRRTNQPKTEEEDVVEKGVILSRGKDSDPTGWDLVKPDLDFNIDTVLRAVERPVEAGSVPDPGDIWKWAMNIVGSWPSVKAKPALQRMATKGLISKTIVNAISDYMSASVSVPDHVSYQQEVAKRLEKLKSPPPPELAPKSGTSGKDKSTESKIKSEVEAEKDKSKKEPGRKELGPAKSVKPKDVGSASKDMLDILRHGGSPERNDGLVSDWGIADMLKPDLSRKLDIRTMRFKAGDTGSFRDVSRLLTDGMAFRDMRRNPKGTVLIDCSGSMSPDPDLIAEIVMRSSAATVALYAGSQGHERGSIVIVGKDGKMHENIPHLISKTFNGCNLIDGPALKWLNTQVGPRIWVSDGRVTGRGESSGGNLYIERNYLCAIGNIERVPSLTEAVPYFKTRR